MTGSAAYARHADVASAARERLDAAAAALAAVDAVRRSALGALVELWPACAWRAAGATSAKRWLLAYTHCSEQEAHRLERVAGLCHRHPALAEAVLSGTLSLAPRQLLHLRSSMGLLRVWVDDRLGWAVDRPRFVFTDRSSVQLRLTAVARQEDDGWHLLHAHVSIGVPNEEVVGRRLTTVCSPSSARSGCECCVGTTRSFGTRSSGTVEWR